MLAENATDHRTNIKTAPGSLEAWRRLGTIHHITTVVQGVWLFCIFC
jgi:hypothetical protein